ncbi:MAG: tetratricopeptide repeat protein [Bacteroidales bacterium]|nr:tetratricopeptide repeat protein [Bacteroidales bacterium]
MKNKLISILLIFLLSSPLFSKESKDIDSLISQLTILPNDTSRLETLFKIIIYYKDENFDKTIYYSDKAIVLSEKMNNKRDLSRALFFKGVACHNKSNYKQALTIFFEKMKIDEERNDRGRIADNYILIGNLYYEAKEYAKAEEYYKKVLETYKYHNNQEGLGCIYNNLGNINEAYKESQKAEEYYLQAINVSKKIKDYSDLVVNYNNLGNLYYKHYNKTMAIRYFNKADSYLDSVDNPSIIALLYLNIGDYYLWREKYDSAHYYLQHSYKVAHTYYLPYFIRDISKSLSEMYAKLNDYKNAYTYQVEYNSINDSVFIVNNSAKLKLLEFQYEIEKEQTQKDINLLKQKKKTRTVSWIIIILFLIVFSVALLFISSQRNKIRRTILIKENIELETKQLKEKLEYRNKKIILMTMNLFERNELINIVVSKLRNILPKTKKVNYPEIEEVIRDLKSNYQENIFKEFEYRFNRVHVDFYKNINRDFQKLTANDLRLCAFLKMNMSTKDIASLTHQSVNSIEVARTRLRKKLNISNSDIDFVSFFTRY